MSSDPRMVFLTVENRLYEMMRLSDDINDAVLLAGKEELEGANRHKANAVIVRLRLAADRLEKLVPEKVKERDAA